MKKYLFVLLLSFTSHLTQADTSAREGAVARLLDLMDAQAQLELAVQSMEERYVRSRIEHWNKVRKLTVEQQTKLAASEARLSELFRAHFSWERMQPRFIHFFATELTAGEIEQAIEFYSSDQSQPVPDKLYVVTVRSNGLLLEEALQIHPIIGEELNKDLVEIGIRQPVGAHRDL